MQTVGLFLALVLLLTACANVDDGGASGKRAGDDTEMKKITKPFGIDYDSQRLATPYNQYANHAVPYDLNTLRRPEQHVMTNLAFNQRLTNVVSSMDGIHAGFVMVANQRAYVAIILDATANGGRSGDRKQMARKLPPVPGTDQVIQDQEKIRASVKPGDVATPMNTKRAVGDVAKELKLAIAQKIGGIDRSIQEVYVSSNRAFINQLGRYMVKSLKGQSLRPHVKEFERSVQKVLAAKTKEVTLASQTEMIRQGTDGQSGGTG